MAIAGFFCAIAGTLFVIYSQSTYPDLFLWTSSGIPVFMVVIGGMYKYIGPIIGAVVYEIAHHFLIGYTQDWQLVLGLVLVVIVLLRPDGLAGAFDGLMARRRGRVSPAGGES
jgi:branched-chain amino acid transport system permease protein